MYKIIIKNLKIFAYHGVHNQEKQNGQDFILDIIAFVESDFNDNISSTVNYSELAEFSKKIMLIKKYNLIETVADVIANSIINKFYLIKKVRVLLKKPNAPTNLDFKYMAVELEKER